LLRQVTSVAYFFSLSAFCLSVLIRHFCCFFLFSFPYSYHCSGFIFLYCFRRSVGCPSALPVGVCFLVRSLPRVNASSGLFLSGALLHLQARGVLSSPSAFSYRGHRVVKLEHFNRCVSLVRSSVSSASLSVLLISLLFRVIVSDIAASGGLSNQQLRDVCIRGR